MDRPTVDPKRVAKLTRAPWDFDAPEYGEPGQAAVLEPEANRCVLRYACPGCGRVSDLRVGFGHRPVPPPACVLVGGDPADETTWGLVPAIDCPAGCGWHGHLNEGTFAPG